MIENNRTELARRTDTGQATILLVIVIIAAVAIGIGLATIANAMVHRARATTAADAIALAAAADPEVGNELAEWYREQGIVVDQVGPRTLVRSGPSQAGAQASTEAGSVRSAPALAAIMARAEQLTDRSFDQIRWQQLSVLVPPGSVTDLQLVAAELGLCEIVPVASLTAEAEQGWVEFELC